MRLRAPRITPLSDNDMSDEQKEVLAHHYKRGRVLNIFRTLVRSPKGYKRFSLWGGYILGPNSDLDPREREILILRAGFNCKSGYEWAQHKAIGLDSGLTEVEIEAIKVGAEDPSWKKSDALLITAADELTEDKFISNDTWAALQEFFTQKQMMDAVMTVGQYTQVSMMLNSFGIQLEEGQELDEDLVKWAQ